ncbi:MAG: hypothetical protein ACLQDF_16785 [Desulfomonilia bacterium]
MKKDNEGSRCSYTVNDTGVALMEIDNPPMNALSWAVLDEIRDTFVKALTDPEVRVICSRVPARHSSPVPRSAS